MENNENPSHSADLNQALYPQTISALPSGAENRRIPTSYYGDASWTNVPRSHIVKSSGWEQRPAAEFQQPHQTLQTQQSHYTQDTQQQQQPKAIQPDHETTIQILPQDRQSLTEIRQQTEIQHQQLIRSNPPSRIELPSVPLFSSEGAPSIQKSGQDVQLQDQTQQWELIKIGNPMTNPALQQKQQTLKGLEQGSEVTRHVEKNHEQHLSRQNLPSRIELPPPIISINEVQRHENDRHAQLVKWNADFEQQQGRHDAMQIHSLTPQQARELKQAQVKLLKNSTSSGGLTAPFSSRPDEMQLNDEVLLPVAQHASQQRKSKPHDSKKPRTPHLQRKHNQTTSLLGFPSQQEPNAAWSNNTKKSHPVPNAQQSQPSRQSRQKSIPLPSSLPRNLKQQEQVHQSQRSSKVRHSVEQSSRAFPPPIPQSPRQQQQWEQDLFEIPGEIPPAWENSNVAQTVNTRSQVSASFLSDLHPDGQALSALPSESAGFASPLEQPHPGSFQPPQVEYIDPLTKPPLRMQVRELNSFQSQATSSSYPTRPQQSAAGEQQALRDLFAAQEALEKAKQDKIDLTKRLEEIDKAMLFKITEMQTEAKGRKKRLPNMTKDLIDYSILMSAGGYGYGIPGELDWEDSDIEMTMSGGEKCDRSSVNYGGRKEATQTSVSIVSNSNEDREAQDGPPPKRGRGRPRVRPLDPLRKRKN